MLVFSSTSYPIFLFFSEV